MRAYSRPVGESEGVPIGPVDSLAVPRFAGPETYARLPTLERVGRAGATFKARPAHRTQSEIRMRDPEGSGCDLSQRGWEVDTDKWVRAEAALHI